MIAMDPNQRHEFSLAIDKPKPAESRPTFIGRYSTARDMVKVDTLLDKIDDGISTDEALAIAVEAISVMLVDWRNVTDATGRAIAFKPADLPDLVTRSEIWELIYALISGARLSEADKKNSASQSVSATGPSATPATIAAA